MNQKPNNQPNSARPATPAQLTKLRDWYEYSIGYHNAMWYIDYLKRQKMTVTQASAEMDRLAKLRLERSPSAMKPKDWDEVNPGAEATIAFVNSLSKPKEENGK